MVDLFFSLHSALCRHFSDQEHRPGVILLICYGVFHIFDSFFEFFIEFSIKNAKRRTGMA